MLDSVYNQVRAQVLDQVWQVRAQAWAQVRNQVWGKVRAQVWGQVLEQSLGKVGGLVTVAAWDQVREGGVSKEKKEVDGGM